MATPSIRCPPRRCGPLGALHPPLPHHLPRFRMSSVPHSLSGIGEYYRCHIRSREPSAAIAPTSKSGPGGCVCNRIPWDSAKLVSPSFFADDQQASRSGHGVLSGYGPFLQLPAVVLVGRALQGRFRRTAEVCRGPFSKLNTRSDRTRTQGECLEAIWCQTSDRVFWTHRLWIHLGGRGRASS